MTRQQVFIFRKGYERRTEPPSYLYAKYVELCTRKSGRRKEAA